MPDGGVLEIAGLEGFYGASQVLHGVDLVVNRGEAVSLLGRNGAGKTTTLRAAMGILESRRGSITLFGTQIISAPPDQIARLGVGYVPEERGIYASLDVRDNLLLPPVIAPGGMTLEEIYRLFPNLRERRGPGTRLSGGEQQMLAIARVLRTGASVLLLDEPTEGLAPIIVEQIVAVVAAMKRKGITIVLVEQNVSVATRLCDRHYVMEGGRIIDMIPAAQIAASMHRLGACLAI